MDTFLTEVTSHLDEGITVELVNGVIRAKQGDHTFETDADHAGGAEMIAILINAEFAHFRTHRQKFPNPPQEVRRSYATGSSIKSIIQATGFTQNQIVGILRNATNQAVDELQPVIDLKLKIEGPQSGGD